VRGDVVDVYLVRRAGRRIELFGDQVEELITFDPLTGRR
jgi:transcription-repair coupling factor (superfamily II helicase)